MGAVGLNFGSPTSGTGFDVSTTVSEIVGNLQNVETPWKNQLATLQTQDTAISSLGTLFSNLSNDMSSLTDFSGIMALKEGSSSDQNVLTLTSADATAVAGTHTVTVTNLAQTSSGYLTQIASASDKLTGSVTIQAGSGAPMTITLNSSNNTLAGLASTINSTGSGITASVLTDASGSMLSLVSGTSGAQGNITVSANTIVATSAALAYTGTAGSSTVTSSGSLAAVANPSNILTGSLSIKVGSGTAKTIVLGSVTGTPPANTIYTGSSSGDTTLSGLESTINANSSTLGVTASIVTSSSGVESLSLVSNTAGSSGTLTVTSNVLDNTSLGYTSSVTGKDANLTVDGIALTSASNTVANLIPGVTFQLLAPSAAESDKSLEQVQVVIGNDNTGVESTFTQMVSDYNSLISAINTQEGNDSSGKPEPLFGSPTLTLLQQQLLSGLNLQNPNGTLTSISSTTDTTLAGSIKIQVGSGTAQTITLSSDNTIAGLASAINKANIGVTANVVTKNGQSTLSLASLTAGSSGALTVSSSITATSDTPLSYTGTDGTTKANSSGTLTEISGANDTLSGTISIQVGSGSTMTVSVPSSPNNNLNGLAAMINELPMGVTASVVQNEDGSYSLSLYSQTSGSTGDLTVTSTLLDSTDTNSASLNYTNSSDINNLTSLGVSVNNDGSLTFDAASLDSVLNTDYSSVVGFFQNTNSWGQTFSTILTDSGTSAGTGVLALASTSNSNIESTLNADISKEDALISAQQKSLTTELNTANQIMQELPSELDQVNELYSAITGYNQNSNG